MNSCTQYVQKIAGPDLDAAANGQPSGSGRGRGTGQRGRGGRGGGGRGARPNARGPLTIEEAFASTREKGARILRSGSGSESEGGEGGSEVGSSGGGGQGGRRGKRQKTEGGGASGVEGRGGGSGRGRGKKADGGSAPPATPTSPITKFFHPDTQQQQSPEQRAREQEQVRTACREAALRRLGVAGGSSGTQQQQRQQSQLSPGQALSASESQRLQLEILQVRWGGWAAGYLEVGGGRVGGCRR